MACRQHCGVAGVRGLETRKAGWRPPDEAAARAWQRYRRWTSWIPVVTSGSALWIGILALAFIAFMSTLRKRARRRRQRDEEEVDA